MSVKFPLGLELKALQLIATFAPESDICASALGVHSDEAYRCLEFIYENKWIAGVPLYSNGNDEGILHLQNVRITPAGLSHLENTPNLYYVCPCNGGRPVEWFEHEGPIGAITADHVGLQQSLGALLSRAPHLQLLSIRTNSSIEIGFVNFEELPHRTPNIVAQGKPAHMALL